MREIMRKFKIRLFPFRNLRDSSESGSWQCYTLMLVRAQRYRSSTLSLRSCPAVSTSRRSQNSIRTTLFITFNLSPHDLTHDNTPLAHHKNIAIWQNDNCRIRYKNCNKRLHILSSNIPIRSIGNANFITQCHGYVIPTCDLSREQSRINVIHVCFW